MSKNMIMRFASAIVAGAACVVVGIFVWVDTLNAFTDPNRTVNGVTLFEGLAGSALWCFGITGLFVAIDRLVERRSK